MHFDARPILLIVNDYEPALFALEAMLAGMDVDVRTATGGDQAMACLGRDEMAAVLLDVKMPGMSGFEVAEAVRQLPGGKALPILFITAAHPGSADQFKGYALGAVDYLTAPVQPAILRAKVAVFVELYRQRRRSTEQARLLAEAQQLAHIGSWELSVASGQTSWSEELYRIHRRDPARPPAGHREQDGRFTPESFARNRDAVEQVLRTGQAYELDLELCDGAGWVTARGMAVRDRDGSIVRLRGTVQDISARKRLELERTENLERLRELSRHLVNLQEDLQRRFSTEMHDRISPNLAAIALNVENLAKGLSPGTEKLLQDIRALLADTQAGIRDFCRELRPPILDYAGLPAALEEHIVRFRRQSGLPVHLDVPQGLCLTAETEIQLFRIVQEALCNCARHAHPTRLHVSITLADANVVLRIADDGVGFDAGALARAASPGLGLFTMRERAAYAGGHLTLASQPGQGTCITVMLPNGMEPPTLAPACPPPSR